MKILGLDALRTGRTRGYSQKQARNSKQMILQYKYNIICMIDFLAAFNTCLNSCGECKYGYPCECFAFADLAHPDTLQFW